MVVLYGIMAFTLTVGAESPGEVTPGMAMEQKVIEYRQEMTHGRVVFTVESLENGGREESTADNGRYVIEFDGERIRREFTPSSFPVGPRTTIVTPEEHIKADGERVTVQDPRFSTQAWLDDVFHPNLLGVWAPVTILDTCALDKLLAFADRVNESVTDDSMDGIDAKLVSYDRIIGNHIDTWIAPSRGHAILRRNVENKYGKSTLAGKYQQFPPGVWFPRRVEYMRYDKEGTLKRHEIATVESADFALRPEHVRFKLLSLDLPVGTTVIRNGHTMVWNGRDLEEPADRRTAQLELGDRVANVCRDARVSGLSALALLEGDESKAVSSVTRRLLNSDEVEPILHYIPIRVTAAQLESDDTTLRRFEWPLPTAGEIVLVALDGQAETIGATRIAAHDVDAAVTLSTRFLAKYMAPARDALSMLAEARESARSRDRRVWLIRSGPRCGPCFRLAGWIDEHHDVLEKEFVIVKLMEGVNAHTADVFDEIGGRSSGIPWYAMTDADGLVLATSESPMGNIGMPGSVEGIRHFREMIEGSARILSHQEIDELIESLSRTQAAVAPVDNSVFETRGAELNDPRETSPPEQPTSIPAHAVVDTTEAIKSIVVICAFLVFGVACAIGGFAVARVRLRRRSGA